MSGRIVILEGDITDQEVDAIVNAANSALVLGSGVAGAIRDKGGPTIQAECDAHGPIDVGRAAVTGGGDLAARYVIHAAGMAPGEPASADAVRSAVRHALELAAARGCHSVAIPALGAGVGGLGLQRCAEILLEEARAHLGGEIRVEEIRFVLWGEPAFRLFEAVNDAQRIAEQASRWSTPKG